MLKSPTMIPGTRAWILYLWIFILFWKVTFVQSKSHHAPSNNIVEGTPGLHVVVPESVQDWHRRVDKDAERTAKSRKTVIPSETKPQFATTSGQTTDLLTNYVDKTGQRKTTTNEATTGPNQIISEVLPQDTGNSFEQNNVKILEEPKDVPSVLHNEANVPPPLETMPASSQTDDYKKAHRGSKQQVGATEKNKTPVAHDKSLIESSTEVLPAKGDKQTEKQLDPSEIAAPMVTASTDKKHKVIQGDQQTLVFKPKQDRPESTREKKTNQKSTSRSEKITSPNLQETKPAKTNTTAILTRDEVGKQLKQLANIRIGHHQNLALLKNATKHAEALQKTFRTQKLHLTSYMDALKNLTLQHTEDKKLLSQYTNSIRSKVHDIVKPIKETVNLTKTDKAKEHSSPAHAHLLAKNITETLRARVDTKNLHKSESFWDKKGMDLEDEHTLRSSVTTTVQADPEIQIAIKNTTTEGHIIEDINQYDTTESEVLNSVDAVRHVTEPEMLLEDIHKADISDLQAVRDRLTAKTSHEKLVFAQLVTGRIHGNILAPPAQRCSVKDNMARFRPAESEMDENDSLLYRVDYHSEVDKALEGGPMNYLSDYKNPCWLSKISDDSGSLWYDYSESGLTYKRMSFLYEMRLSKGSNWRMRCLPLLYFVGVTKCGTTDLYSRLLGHPEIMRPAHKEPMWWNRLTLGMAQSLRKSFRYYLDFFDEAAELMRRKVVIKDGKPYHPGITMDATPANLWDYDCWTDIQGNRGLAAPKFTLAKSIKKLVPNAKILMVLREPTERLYSQYRMKSHREPSLTFHNQVVETIDAFTECMKTRTLRSCAYDHEISKHEFGSPGGVFVRASLYYVFVKDWLDVFPPEQVMIVRSEDYHNDTMGTLDEVFRFLDLSPLSHERLAAISRQKYVNTRADHSDRSMEPIMPETKRLLDNFFRPFNKMLAKLLHDDRFTWNDVRQ